MVNIENLLANYKRNTIIETDRLNFHGVEGYDVYNITAPFEYNQKLYIAGRVEKRDSEFSKVVFFEKTDETNYQADYSINSFDLQDPYISIVDGEIILGGTELFDHPHNPGAFWYKAVKYRGTNLNEMTRFFEGPNGMKDIRIIQLPNDKILVFTRPQGEIGGRGKIGTLIVESLEQLADVELMNAPLLNLFETEEWGGANEAHLLPDGKVGVLSHIAKFDREGNRHYYASSFILDAATMEATDFKIITTRSDLTPGQSKRPDLADVVFSGGLILNGDEAKLYVGAGDCEAHVVKIKNPFI